MKANNTMNLFDILSNDERVIVLSDEGAKTIFTWNKSLTLQYWGWFPAEGYKASYWEEFSIRTLSEVPANFDIARKAALEWQVRFF